MPLETEVGDVYVSPNSNNVYWKIPKYFDLPQEYDTIIRSPRFRAEDTDCYMEVYPNGRRLHCSSGWFGIGVCFLNLESSKIVVGIAENEEIKTGFVAGVADSYDSGLYRCNFKFLPTSFLKTGCDSLVPGGNLHVYFEKITDETFLGKFLMQLLRKDAEQCFSSYLEETRKTEEEIQMSLQTDVGEVSISPDGAEWTIPNFCDLPQRHDTIIRSPRFRFEDTDWYMEVYPNGRRMYSSSGWFGISAFNVNHESSFRKVTFGIGSLESNAAAATADLYRDGVYSYITFLPSFFFKSGSGSLVLEGNLCVKFFKEISMDSFMENKQLIFFKRQDAEQCFSAYVEATRQAEEEIGMQKLKQDLKEILLSGNISDVVLKVEGREFNAHRCILAARSPVFLAMMMHETKEKVSGVVDIPDVDSKTFADFLNYLYTGSVDNWTSENAAKLYIIADKYQVNELKKTCLDHMKNISVDNFCDFLALALKYDEKILKENCIRFFIENSLNIVLTPKWQKFLCENPITGNELFIKHLQLDK